MGVRRLSYVLVAVVACSCKPQTEEGPTRPPSGAPQHGGELQLAPAQLPDELANMLGDEKAFEADAPEAPLTYQVPDCKLSYEVRVSADLGASPDGTRRGMRLREDFTLSKGGPADMVVDWGEVHTAHVANDVVRPGAGSEPGTLARTYLKLDGDRLVEVEGPTGAWSAFGFFAGPVVFFGALPKSKVAWAPLVHAQGSGLKVEAERGSVDLKGRKPPEPVPGEFEGSASFVRWVEIGGAQAGLYSASFKDSNEGVVDPDMGPKLETSSSLDGKVHYLVAASGRLLLAHTTTHVEQVMRSDFMPEPLEQTVDTTAELRLVSACSESDLTFPAPPEPSSTSEDALAFLAEHRNRLARKQWQEAARDYAPAVLDAHGESEVAAVLEAHFSRFGARSFGSPELARDVHATDDGDIMVTLTGGAENFDGPSDTRMSVHTQIRVMLVDGKPRIRFARAATTEGGWPMSQYFAVGDERVHSRVRPFGAPPNDQPDSGHVDSNTTF